MEQISDKKLTPDQIDKLTSSLELDLISYFKILENDVLDQVSSGKSINKIMNDIDKLFKE